MKVNFRYEAKLATERAKAELASADDKRLRYAALELRMAIEALTYDKAQAYKKEIHPKEYEKWQPRKLFQMLLDIHPYADQSMTVSIGLEKESGGVGPMHHMGRETVFDLNAVKEHYDALGAYLHTPSLKQVEERGISPDPQRLRARCNSIVDLIEKALASTVYNVTLGTFDTRICGRCNSQIRRRIPHGQEAIEAECFECDAKYTLNLKKNDVVEWMPMGRRISCSTEGCRGQHFFFMDEVKPGMGFQCELCKKEWVIALALLEHKNDR
jgi:hypothetical protein